MCNKCNERNTSIYKLSKRKVLLIKYIISHTYTIDVVHKHTKRVGVLEKRSNND